MSPRPKIQLLEDAVINQIAAGEVVDRPASVVKELLENALDAGATKIRVEIAEGGQALIRVTDNGSGMGPEDAKQCIVRHATSKLRESADLDTISTLGFRGEALPSIASVSRFRLTTCLEGENVGTSVKIDGGSEAEVQSYGASPGTSIEVRDLFFNVPARKKFLKRPGTERNHITDMVLRLALVNPEVGFKLFAEGKSLIDVSGNYQKDPRARLARLLGRETAEKLLIISDDGIARPVRATGFIGSPELSERTTKGYYTFVNGRFVRDKTIQHAVSDAYQGHLEKGRHPVVVLFLQLSPELLDVNVHPQKTEVRFAKSGEVHRAVTSAIRRTLATGGARAPNTSSSPAQPSSQSPKASQPIIGTISASSLAQPSAGVDAYKERLQRAVQKSAGMIMDAPKATGKYVEPPGSGFTPKKQRGFTSPQLAEQNFKLQAPPAIIAPPPATKDEEEARPSAPSTIQQEPLAIEEPAPPSTEALPARSTAEFTALALGLDEYIVCQSDAEIVLADLTAIKERVYFEKLEAAKAPATQALIIPLHLSVNDQESIRLDPELDRLNSCGIGLEKLDAQTYLFKNAPALLQGLDIEAFGRKLVKTISGLAEGMIEEEKRKRVLRLVARNVPQDTNQEALQKLLDQLAQSKEPEHGLNGQSLFVKFPKGMLQKMFLRSGR